ncbi:unnamed protein product, partial [Porites evermanni]
MIKLELFFQAFTLSLQVKSPTRGSRVLDIFATNVPFDFCKIQFVRGLINSDHKRVILSLKQRTPPERKWVEFRDTREHCKLAMSSYLKEIDWPSLLHSADIKSAVKCFCNLISLAVDQFLPKVEVKLSRNDPAFISLDGMVLEADSLEERIDKLIQQNQMNEVRSRNNKHCKSTRQWQRI